MESPGANTLRALLFLLGLTAMATQVIMIREAMAIFNGNELVIGLFLGMWMMLTAAGSFLVSRKSHVPCSVFRVPFFKSTIENRQSTIENDFSPLPRFPASMLVLLAVLPITTLFILVILRFSFIPTGIMPGLGQTTVVLFLALLPFCLVSGMLFPIQIQSLSALSGRSLLSEGYALESAGSIVGGLLFSLVFIFVLPPYESLLLLTGIIIIFNITIFWINKLKVLSICILIASIVFILINERFAPAVVLDKFQFNKQEVVEIKSSPYGMIAVTRINNQFFLYENGVQVSLGDDPISREESVHYAMLLHPAPHKVLLISGGASGSIEEILKYPVSRLDYVEPDLWLIRVASKYKPVPDDRRVNCIFTDARIFLNSNDEKYDVILVNTPEPTSAELNRFYTVEFYKLLKDRMNPGGIISVATMPAGNYISETSRQIHSVAYNSLKTVFNQVRIIPGAKDYFLASDSTIEQSIFKDFQNKGIENNYVNPFYIDENLLKMRSELIMKDMLPNTQLNSDLKPYVFSLFLKQWLERFKINTWLLPLILILALVLSLIFLGPLNLGLFTGGFTAAGLEFILLIWFQVLYGNVYRMTGVIFAIFMAGLVVGSRFLVHGSWFPGEGDKKHTFRGFLLIQGIFASFSALIALLIPLFSSSVLPCLHASMLPCLHASMLPRFPASLLVLILILVLITGLLMGTQFAMSAHLRTSSVIKSSGESFSADLLGSAIGILLVSVYLVPQLGLPITALTLAGMNLVVLAVLSLKSQH